jgi:hypothetical protein
MKPAIPRILVGLLLAGMLATANASTGKYITSKDLQTFDAQSKDVTAGMTKGGRFEFVSTSEQARVTELLGLIHDILVKYPDVKTIGERDKLTVFNSQEEVNEILTKGDGNRLICANEAPVGSHLSKKVCVTQAKKEQQREEARRMLESKPGDKVIGGN